MSETSSKAIAGAAESPVVDNVSAQEYLLRRQPAKEPAKREPEAEPKEETPKAAESEAAAKETPPEATDVLSKAKTGNLDDLSAEELDHLAKLVGSKAVARFGELTAKRKAAEERAAMLEATLARQNQEKAAHEPVKDNPFAAISDPKELQAKASEIKQVIDFAEEKLDEADGLQPDAVVVVVDGKEYTKRQLRETLRKARKARDEYLPDVSRRLALVDQAKQLRESLNVETRKQLPWMEDEADERKKRYDAMVSDPRLKKIEEVAPDIAAQLPYLLAHASNSMYARREIPLTEKGPAKASPPENPSSGAAVSRSPEGVKSKQEKELRSQVAGSGLKEDWLALRTAQLSKRKKIA